MNDKSIAKDKEAKLEAFFTDLLVDEGGIFTLMGSKPMTEVYWKRNSRKMEPWSKIEKLEISKDFLLVRGKECHPIDSG